MATYWFLEPKNDFANDALAQELANRGLADESFCRGLIDNFGKSHNLIRVSFPMIKFILESQKFYNRFRVFNRRGNNGQLRDLTGQVKRWGKHRRGA